MGEKYVDLEQLRRMARDAQSAADGLDAAEASRPDSVDAGPFTPVVMDLVEATAAQTVDLVMRLRTAADRMHEAAEYYEYQEQFDTEYVTSVEKLLASFDDIDPSKPTYGELLDDLRGDGAG